MVGDHSKTVQIRIRLLHFEQSDLDLHCLLHIFCPRILGKYGTDILYVIIS